MACTLHTGCKQDQVGSEGWHEEDWLQDWQEVRQACQQAEDEKSKDSSVALASGGWREGEHP